MKILNQPPVFQARVQSNPGPDPQDPNNKPPEKERTMVDKIVDGTYLGANYLASGLSGTAAGLGAYVRSAPGATLSSTASLYKNMWKAETIGPNLKVIGSVVALPLMLTAGAIGLPVSLGSGLYLGSAQVDSTKPRQFTVPEAAEAGYSKTCKGWNSAAEGLKESLDRFGNEKLAEGEKPLDIPLFKLGKTVAMGVAGVAVGGVAGVVTAGLTAVCESGRGIYQSFTDESLSFPGKALGAVGAVVGGVAMGASNGLATLVSEVGYGIGTTWKKDSFIEGGKRVFGEAGLSIAASVAPHSTLLREKEDRQ